MRHEHAPRVDAVVLRQLASEDPAHGHDAVHSLQHGAGDLVRRRNMALEQEENAFAEDPANREKWDGERIVLEVEDDTPVLERISPTQESPERVPGVRGQSPQGECVLTWSCLLLGARQDGDLERRGDSIDVEEVRCATRLVVVDAHVERDHFDVATRLRHGLAEAHDALAIDAGKEHVVRREVQKLGRRARVSVGTARLLDAAQASQVAGRASAVGPRVAPATETAID